MRKIFLAALLSVISLPSFAQTIPDVQVEVKGGRKVLISDLIPKDTMVIVSFWATWCGPCMKELDELNYIYPTLTKSYPIKILAISTDDRRNSRKVFPKAAGSGWEFDVAIDENQEVARLMNVNSIPMLFLIDQFGKIAYSHQGYTPASLETLLDEIDKIYPPR
jgi:cytochrome c biogenesis protein CcmG/thiol:disulfide interchange protein DsbE